jgi:hypothetical protein
MWGGDVNRQKRIISGTMNFDLSGLLSPPAGAVSCLYFSPAIRALIYCIAMTICPYTSHFYKIVIIITHRSLKFHHIFSSSR